MDTYKIYTAPNSLSNNYDRQEMSNRLMKDREINTLGTDRYFPEVSDLPPSQRVKGGSITLKSPHLSNLMSLFDGIGVEGIRRVMAGNPYNDQYIITEKVYNLPNKKVLNSKSSTMTGGAKRKIMADLKMMSGNKGRMTKDKVAKALMMLEKLRGGEGEEEEEEKEEDLPDDDVEDIKDYEMVKPKEGTTGRFRIKSFFEDLPEHAPPEIRKWLEQWGDATITDAKICRVPLNSAIQKVGNLMTLGKLNKKAKELNYENLFHLFVVLTLKKPNGETKTFLTEKNQKVEVRPFTGLPPNGVCMPQKPTKKVLLLDAFKRAEKRIGVKKFWVYSLGGVANCQSYSVGLLGSGNNMLTPEGRKFAMQSPDQLLPQVLLKTTDKITNFANKIRSFWKGKGRIGGSNVDYCLN